MAKVKVTFLNKEYMISDQIPLLVPILNDFDDYKDEIISLLLSQMNKNQYTGGADEDFAYWDKPIRSIAKKVIVAASHKGVFDLTEYDLVDQNSGYNELKTICKNTIKQIANSLAESIQEYINDVDAAYKDAASNITGSGVSIWTNSLSSALWYNFLEGNVLRKQAKEADRQYNEAIRNINSRNTSKQKANENRIKTEYYYPGCKLAIEKTIAIMMNVYLSSLNNNNIINCSELSAYDMKASSEIMKNLNIISQKEEVLGKAFEKCPYNQNIFVSAIDLRLLDDLSVDTLNYLNLSNDIETYLDDRIGNAQTMSELRSLVNHKKYFIHLKALFSKENEVLYKKHLAFPIYKAIIDEYSKYNQLCLDDSKCEKFTLDIKSIDDLEVYIARRVKEIVSEDDLRFLISQCGYYAALNDIKPEGISDEGLTKEEIDIFLIKSISDKCKPIIKEKIDKEQKEKEKRILEEEKERIRQEEEKRKKAKQMKLILAATMSIVLISALLFFIVFVIVPDQKLKKQLNEVEDLKKANKYDEAISILEQLEADYSEQINECKYEKAEKLMAEGNYGDAIIAYNDVGNYKDSKQKKNECTYIRACEMEDNGDKKSANELFYDIKDYKDSYKRYIRNSVDIGYIVCKTKYEFNYKNDLTNECTSEELAYKVLKLNEYAKPESIKLYILIIENGKEHRFGNIVISGTYPEKTIGEYTFGIDSEFYAFENKDDYNNNLYENAVFHETLTCNEATTAIRDGISINAGFCTYDSDETNIKDQTSYSWMKGQGTYGYKVHGKPYIKVDGLNENEEISLYMSIVLYPLDGSPIIRMEEGETIITYGNNCIIEDIAPDWKNGVVNVGYSGDIRLYVFSDYISYINQDYENAVAMGEIKYSE